MVNRLLVGPPGVGKTAHVMSKYDFVETVLASTMVEEDLAGLPYQVDGEERRTNPPMFQRVRDAVKQGKRVAVFFDELDKARRSVADTLLSLITAPRGDGARQFPASVDIWAAANPPDYGGGDGISQAMLSRFAVIQFDPDLPQWLSWQTDRLTNGHGPLDSDDVRVKIMSAIGCGELPLFDVVGEGLEQRITCPRTYTMMFDAWEEEDAEALIKGLLTPGVAAHVSLLRSKTHKPDRAFTRAKAHLGAVIQPVRV